jgi:transposase
MQTQIKQMSEQGHSIRTIARVLKLSRRTVRKYLEPAPLAAEKTSGWEAEIDWDHVREEVNARGTTIKQIGREVAPEVEYVKFWRAYWEYASPVASPSGVTIRLDHKPGEKVQVDFSDGVWLTDRATGKKTLTQFFLGVLPFSSHVFGEFALDQKLPTFIGLHERMFAYFGGVTPYLVLDNLKSGVHKAHLYDPDVNPTYCDFANHMGFAVLPARPRKPRDKGCGESHIGVFQRDFYQRVRDQVFYSLEELNAVLRRYLEHLTQEVMKDYGVSRAQRFDEEKKH